MKIATLIIEKEKGGFLAFEPGKEEKQRIVIKANGAVWFTTYGVETTDGWKYKAIRKMRCRMDKQQAESILAKAAEFVDSMHGIDGYRVCDGEQDYITVISENGEKVKKLVNEGDFPEVEDIYGIIRKALPIDKLLMFDYDFYTE